MRGNFYTFTNLRTSKTFSIGVNTDGSVVSQIGRGLLLTEYPVFELEVRNDSINKTGQHGIVDFYSFYGARTINFSGVIMANSYSDLMSFQNQIRQVLSLPAQPETGNDGYIKISWTDVNSDSWEIYAKISQDVQFTRPSGNQLLSNFFIALKSRDYYIFSQNSNSLSQLKGWIQTGGIGFPMFTNISIAEKYFNAMSIYNSGATEVPPTFRIYGPVVNPKIYKILRTTDSNTVISTFATGWVGGVDDPAHFLEGLSSRKLTSVGGVADSMSMTGSFDLTNYADIVMYMYIDDITKIKFGNYLGAENYIKLKTNTGTDEFVKELFQSINDDSTILHNLDSATDWHTRNDASNLALDTTEYKEGMGSLKCDITTSANRASLWNDDLVPANLYKYKENGVFRLWVYLPSITHLTNAKLYVGDDISNNWVMTATTDINGNALAVGWNFLEFDWGIAVKTGSPDANLVNYIEIELNYTASYGNHTNFRIDAIEFVPKQTQTILGNTLKNGWNTFVIAKNDFKIIGNPTWGNITEIEMSIQSVSGTLNVSFDDLQAKNFSYTEVLFGLDTALDYREYVDVNMNTGIIENQDGTDYSPYISSTSSWLLLDTGENLFVLIADNANPELTGEYPDLPQIQDGLIGHWKLDENTGTVATDFSGRGNNGIITSGEWVEGVDGGIAIEMSKNDINFGSGVDFDLEKNEPFSAMMFIKNKGSASQTLLGKIENDATSRGFRFKTTDITGLEGKNLKLDLISNSAVGDITTIYGNTDLNLNNDLWRSVAFSYDGSSSASGVKFYVDGIEEDTTVVSGILTGTIRNTASFKVHNLVSSSYGVRVDYDNIMFFNREIASGEVYAFHEDLAKNYFTNPFQITWKQASI